MLVIDRVYTAPLWLRQAATNVMPGAQAAACFDLTDGDEAAIRARTDDVVAMLTGLVGGVSPAVMHRDLGGDVLALGLGGPLDLADAASARTYRVVVAASSAEADSTDRPKPIGYLKPRVEGAEEPWFVHAADFDPSWMSSVFTQPVFAGPGPAKAAHADPAIAAAIHVWNARGERAATDVMLAAVEAALGVERERHEIVNRHFTEQLRDIGRRLDRFMRGRS